MKGIEHFHGRGAQDKKSPQKYRSVTLDGVSFKGEFLVSNDLVYVVGVV